MQDQTFKQTSVQFWTGSFTIPIKGT